jgi:hypothetical protein
MRLLVAAIWLGGGAYGIHTFFKYRSYVDSLPPDPDNNALKRKYKRQLFWSLASVCIGIWWALSNWFPGVIVHFP